MEKQIRQISGLTNLPDKGVKNVLELLEQGATIPFIARYRKEMTGNLDEEQITTIRDTSRKLAELEDRRESILRSIDEQGKLTAELQEQLESAESISQLEDLYLPYKSKRKTRADKAAEKGLEPLAATIMSQKRQDVAQLANKFVDPSKNVHTADEALQGAGDIMAAWINERIAARNRVRRLLWREGKIESKISKGKEAAAEKYSDYFDYSENIRRIPSHRYLAISRGEKEGLLNVKLVIDQDIAMQQLEPVFIGSEGETASLIRKAMKDSLKRLMQPSLESEIRSELKERSDAKAIEIFRSNLYQLLMAPPLGEKRVLAIDPGFRTGCKVVCLDGQGNLLDNDTIYPHPPQRDTSMAAKKIRSLVDAYRIEAIAVGNGTAGRETEAFLQNIKFNREVVAVTVNESGASVYSASKVARKEFPEYDVTVRGAVSIGRRLMDPLAELVKIDPQAIGVGQYQHDVDQGRLAQSLDDTVMKCVNAVGVEVNTASSQLLTYVSGIGPALAENIVKYREIHGPFGDRQQLKKVPKLGPKAFEQSAGFLRIKNGKQPLDASAVHPESYHVVKKMAATAGVKPENLIRNSELIKSFNPRDFVSEKAGLFTVTDILRELEKPGRDPRENIKKFEFDTSLKSIEDIKPGLIIPGQVTNITAFGCFVDIGIKENGLVHISELANRFVSDPAEVVVLNQQVMVKVLSVDLARKRIQLSMKELE